MIDRPDDEVPRLPREWLPDPLEPHDSPIWERRVEQVMAAVEPTIRGLQTRPSELCDSWANVLGTWWKPAAALAAVAAGLVLALGLPTPQRELDPRTVSLRIVAAGGEPAALWEVFGVEADPVLARIALDVGGP